VWHCLEMWNEIVSAVEHGITVYQEGTLPVVSYVFYEFYNVSAVWQEAVFKDRFKKLLLIFSIAISLQMTSVY